MSPYQGTMTTLEHLDGVAVIHYDDGDEDIVDLATLKVNKSTAKEDHKVGMLICTSYVTQPVQAEARKIFYEETGKNNAFLCVDLSTDPELGDPSGDDDNNQGNAEEGQKRTRKKLQMYSPTVDGENDSAKRARVEKDIGVVTETRATPAVDSQPRCSTCGRTGHMRSSHKSCPMYNAKKGRA